MNKDSKSIFKMQEAGSVPEVNQYGLTEEQMQSVRDNVRRYGLSEEDAVANKIKAMDESKSMMRNIISSLDGDY
jgi:Glu-tRNA(Gln) amidotransferase subunit E-like FAD-binding protein